MSDKGPVKVALIQQSCPGSLYENQIKSAHMIRQAALEGAELILLPELHSTPYFCQKEDPSYFDYAENIPGKSSAFFGALAAELKIVLMISLFEKRLPGLYHNTAVVFDRDSQIAGVYRKMHIPNDPGYSEKYYFTPGDQGFRPIKTSVGNLGILICWDQWFPEAARLMALAGADCLIFPTAIGWSKAEPDPSLRQKQREAWETIQRGHSIANGLPVFSINRVGEEIVSETESQIFWGHSFATGAFGEFQMKSAAPGDRPCVAATEEEILYATLNTSDTKSIRHIWPFLRDRRLDHYAALITHGENQNAGQ